MSVTRLKRKHRKNIARANNETNKIKNLLRTPVLKNVDLDELKAKFSQAAPPDVAAKSDKAPVPATDRAAAESQAAVADQPAAKEESLLDKVSHAASAALDTVKHAASDAVEAVTHTSAYGAVQEAAHNLVEGTKQVLKSEEQPEAAAPATSEPAKNEEAKVNQTGTEGFDEAEAVTKPVNEDGQEGEHPKPEIHL